MVTWHVWLKSIGQAVVKKGLRALAGMVPFGEAVYGIAAEAAELVKKQVQREEDRRALLQELIQASEQQIQQAAEEVVREAAAAEAPEVQRQLCVYLIQVPAIVRQSLRRPEDPAGKTVPAACGLSNAEDLLPLLPARLPRFKAGDRPAGIGDWELQQLLGVGGFGEVWRARNPHFDGVAPAALKFCLDAAARERLRHEAAVLNQILRQGNHPGIVALKHTYLSADPPCLEYEYVAGGVLTTVIQKWHQSASRERERPEATAERVIQAMRGLASILAFAHRLNPPIVHRDLKPANILVQPKANGTSVLRVADFGIGGAAAPCVEVKGAPIHTRAATRQAHVLGASLLGSYTPLYASPQQMSGTAPDPRDDVHALGVICLQMLTGDLTRGAVADWRDELAELHVPDGLMQVLARCLASRAEKRWANAAVLLEELTRLKSAQTAEPTSTRITPFIPVNLPDRAEDDVNPSVTAINGQPKTNGVPGAAEVVGPQQTPRNSGPFRNFKNGRIEPVRSAAKILVNSIGMKLVLIRSGKFVMGSPADEEGRFENEEQREIAVAQPFYLGKFAVTQAEFRAVLGKNPSRFKGDKLPVETVTWLEAKRFCAQLSQDEGLSYSLPTEEEWEYVCRAGAPTPFHWGTTIGPDQANIDGSLGKTAEADLYPANAWGVHGMHGNVWEWCENWYPGERRVVRGGSWNDARRYCRSAARFSDPPKDSHDNVGFRVVLRIGG